MSHHGFANWRGNFLAIHPVSTGCCLCVEVEIWTHNVGVLGQEIVELVHHENLLTSGTLPKKLMEWEVTGIHWELMQGRGKSQA